MLGLVFKKIGMTRVFDDAGVVSPVTVLKMEINRVVGFRDQKKDGYSAIMIGVGSDEKEKRKFLKGFYGDLPFSRKIRECRVEEGFLGAKKGFIFSVSSFLGVAYVDVRGISIGKGFQGVIRRHGMSGGPGGHGSTFHRHPGSVGNCSDPSRIFKGKKMPGRMGGVSVCVQNVKIVGLEEKDGVVLLGGGVPGPRGAFLELSPSVKKKQVVNFVFDASGGGVKEEVLR